MVGLLESPDGLFAASKELTLIDMVGLLESPYISQFQYCSWQHIVRDILLGFFLHLLILLTLVVFFLNNRVLKYDMQNLEIPTIHLLGALVKSGIRVLVYR
jgi:hypothetical protein